MNKESYSYYKQAYRANKRYKVKIGSDDYGPMLSKEEYEEYPTDLVVYKEPGFIKKFFNLIKGIFKKNKF